MERSVFGRWKIASLEEPRSLATEQLAAFKGSLIDRPDTSEDKNFEQKFKAQLATEEEEVTRLAHGRAKANPGSSGKKMRSWQFNCGQQK
jgi:hypothetical protein